MYKSTLVSILLSVILLPCFSQQISYNEEDRSGNHAECTTGITSFSPTCASPLLDSVVHFEFKEGQADPNISRRIFYFDENNLLDSIAERYQDRIYQYLSGYTISYSYDGSGRVQNVVKSSWNSSLQHLSIHLKEAYTYEDVFFRRLSNIEWRTAADTSSLDFHEDYYYDAFHQLVDYTMFVPPEINPEDATYRESYEYDSIGLLTYARKDLSEAGETLNLTENRFQNFYYQDSLPSVVYTTVRTGQSGDWDDAGMMRYFYDDLDRNTMRAETKAMENDVIYEKQVYTFDDANNLTSKVRYISSDSVDFRLADSILYYHSPVDVDGEDEGDVEEEDKDDPGEEEIAPPDPFEFTLYPNPTEGILHVRSGIDSPSEIRIVDASGRVIIVRRVENGIAEIDLTPYPEGYYIVMLVSNMGYQTGRVFKY